MVVLCYRVTFEYTHFTLLEGCNLDPLSPSSVALMFKIFEIYEITFSLGRFQAFDRTKV
jgi:hypothetical protein